MIWFVITQCGLFELNAIFNPKQQVCGGGVWSWSVFCEHLPERLSCYKFQLYFWSKLTLLYWSLTTFRCLPGVFISTVTTTPHNTANRSVDAKTDGGFNTVRPKQNGLHVAGTIFKCIVLTESFYICLNFTEICSKGFKWCVYASPVEILILIWNLAGSSAAEMPAKFQNDKKTLNTNRTYKTEKSYDKKHLVQYWNRLWFFPDRGAPSSCFTTVSEIRAQVEFNRSASSCTKRQGTSSAETTRWGPWVHTR